MEERTRVVLADDHTVVRAGVKATLEQASDLVVVGEVEDGAEVEAFTARSLPDVLVLDVNMAGLDPVAVTRRLKQQHPSLQILILTAYDDDAYVQGLLAAGATGYVLKEEAAETLIAAIRAVARDESWLSQRIAGRLAQKVRAASADPLTPRENEVLRLLALGPLYALAGARPSATTPILVGRALTFSLVPRYQSSRKICRHREVEDGETTPERVTLERGNWSLRILAELGGSRIASLSCETENRSRDVQVSSVALGSSLRSSRTASESPGRGCAAGHRVAVGSLVGALDSAVPSEHVAERQACSGKCHHRKGSGRPSAATELEQRYPR